MSRRRIDWQTLEDGKTIELHVQEQLESGEWQDISDRFRIKTKQGQIYILSLKHFEESTAKLNDDELTFFNLHIYDKVDKAFKNIGIMAKHTYLNNAIKGALERGDLYLALGTKAVKLQQDKLKTFVKYDIVPLDKELATKLDDKPYEEKGHNRISEVDIEEDIF